MTTLGELSRFWVVDEVVADTPSDISPKRMAALSFGRELRKAMKARGIGRRRLAEGLGWSSKGSIIAYWLKGQNLPRTELAARVATLLAWPRLEELGVAARTCICPCGVVFVNESSGPRRYHSDSCRKTRAKSRFGVPTRLRADKAERALGETQTALSMFAEQVGAMCRSCEPEGLCHQGGCPLRAVSPLGLAGHVEVVRQLRPAPGPYGTEEAREKTLLAIRAGNARRWGSPGARDEASRRMREVHAGMTPAEKREWLARVTAGARQARTSHEATG